jgi:hypothetical protein
MLMICVIVKKRKLSFETPSQPHYSSHDQHIPFTNNFKSAIFLRMGPKKGGTKDAKASGSKSKDTKESKDDKKKLKPATSINVSVQLFNVHFQLCPSNKP